MSSEFGCFVFLLQKTHQSSSVPLFPASYHFQICIFTTEKTVINKIFYLYVETSVLLNEKKPTKLCQNQKLKIWQQTKQTPEF